MNGFTKLKIAISSLLLLSASAAFCENFRTATVSVINLEETSDYEKTVQMGLNDALAVYIPENPLYLEALELKMDIPEGVALWRDCTGFYIYDSIFPAPKSDQIDYSGKKIYSAVLPSRLSWIVQIPLIKDFNSKTNQYITKVDKIPDISNHYVFIRFMQIMKGVPDEIEASVIPVTVKPILMDKGQLKISFAAPASSAVKNQKDETDEIPSDKDETPAEAVTDKPNPLENITVFIDEDYVYPMMNSGDGTFLLDSGVHNISIISEDFRTEVRTVRIDQAKTTEIEIKLKSIEPSLLVLAPSETKVFLDDEEYQTLGTETPITEGDHKIRFTIGDYEIVRNLSASKGKTYTVDLSVDINISEE